MSLPRVHRLLVLLVLHLHACGLCLRLGESLFFLSSQSCSDLVASLFVLVALVGFFLLKLHSSSALRAILGLRKSAWAVDLIVLLVRSSLVSVLTSVTTDMPLTGGLLVTSVFEWVGFTGFCRIGWENPLSLWL